MSEVFATSDALARAKEWLDAANPRWRLQTMQHRARYNPRTGEYRQLPTRVRRFLNGTPSGLKAAVLQVLRESAPYSSPVFDLELDGLVYMPTNTYIRKDGAECVTNQRDATYTIIQDLKLYDEAGDRFSFGDGSTCSELGEAEYRWDEDDVEDCPDGSQGVSYQVTDVSRDRETDLFSYRLRKVTALTQHMPPVVTQCDARKRVTVETWNNVYGEPGGFRYDPVRGGSVPIALPAPCDSADGVDVRLSVSENADCTYRLELVTTEAKVDEGQFSAYRDQYKAQFSDRTFNAAAPLGRRGVEYARETVDGQLRGVVTKYESSRNEDGSWNNDVSREEERPVPSSTVEVRVMPRHTATVRVDTNMPAPAAALPDGARFGSWKSVKTPGGLFTNEYVSYARAYLGNLGLLCTDTAFLKTHETQATAASVPSGSHVPPAGGGLVTTWNYDTDAEGTVVRRERTEQEHTVENAVRRRAWGWLGTTSGFTHRSVPWSVASGLLDGGGRGTSVEARMTNGRLWDVEVQTFLRLSGQSLGLDCEKTVYRHVHETAVSADAVGDEASDAGGGATHRRSFRLDTATGAVTQTDSTTYELHVPESRRSVRVTARGTTVRTTASNAPAAPADASAVGSSTEFEVTPGGRFNVTVEETSPREGPLGKACSDDLFLHTDGTTRAQAAPADPSHVAPAGLGVYRELRQRLGDDGLWEVDEQSHAERHVPYQRVEERVTRLGLVRRVTHVQGTDEGEPLSAALPDVGRERLVEKTRGDRRNLTTVSVTPLLVDSEERCERDAFLHSTTTSRGVAAPDLGGHVGRAGGGVYRERTFRLNDAGAWERVLAEHVEERPQWRSRDYVDAFGATQVLEDMSAGTQDGERGGTEFTPGHLIRHVEAQMTKGVRFNARTTVETPTEVDSGWLHFEKTTDKGLAIMYDFIVFRNAAMEQVRGWIAHLEQIRYTGWAGSFANHPQISISPNRFRLWDGSVSLTTTFTPKAWASGGSTKDDNWGPVEYQVKDVSVSPMNAVAQAGAEGSIYLLKAVVTEYHKRGGGVGEDKLEAVLGGPGTVLIRGSQFSYHPSGQAFQYDIITKRTISYKVVKASADVEVGQGVQD